MNRNKVWSQHTFVQGIAVGLGSDPNASPISMNMKASEPGNSCSGTSNIFNCAGTDISEWFRWKVNAYSLPAVMKAYSIPTRKTTFIKLDVESFECSLLPSWKQWLIDSGNQKPTLYVRYWNFNLVIWI